MKTPMPKLLLITASSPEIRKVRRSRVLSFQQITMPYPAARVPPGWDVVHVDEEAEEINWDVKADVVGITFHTPSAYHAYDIASRFRSRGTYVVMGGPHVTLLPAEASQHADVIFIGEAEGLWEEFLQGFATKSYRSVYQQTRAPLLQNIPMARKDCFHRRDHTNGVLFATRGCPNHCDFCTLAVMYKNRHRQRPDPGRSGGQAGFLRTIGRGAPRPSPVGPICDPGRLYGGTGPVRALYSQPSGGDVPP